MLAFLAWEDDTPGVNGVNGAGVNGVNGAGVNGTTLGRGAGAGAAGGWSYETFALAEAPYGEWTVMRVRFYV